MAIIKKTQRKGFECEYWRILQIDCNADRADAVATFGLYKDRETRLADLTAVIDQFQIDLGSEFNDKILKDDTKIKDKVKKTAYEALKEKAIAEASKEVSEEGESRDESLAFFADAVSDI